MDEQKHFDVVIIGGGPSGISAAIWSCDLGLSTAIIDGKSEFGGQLLRVNNPITNYPGRSAANGRELRDHLIGSMGNYAPVSFLQRTVVKADLENKRITFADGEAIEGAVIILATGVRRRRLGVSGETEFAGRGIMESGVGEKENCKDKSVLIVGGGDAALENASILGEYASRVYVVHRRAEFSARKEFVDSAKTNPRVEIRYETVVREFSGGQKIESVEIENVRTGAVQRLRVDAVLIRAGVEPNTDLFTDPNGIDGQGYIIVDQYCRTSVIGVFAVGDVANPVSPTIVTAAGMGATAAKSAFDLLYRKQSV